MIPKKVRDFLTSNDWIEEDAFGSIFILDPWISCYLESYYVYKKRLYSIDIFSLFGNQLYEWTLVKESKLTLQWVLDTAKKNKSYFIKKEKEYLEVCKEIDGVFRLVRDNGLGNYSKKDLKKLWLDLCGRLGRKQFGYSVLSECLDILQEEDYIRYLKNVPSDKLLDVLSLLSTPTKLSFLDKERISLLNTALLYKKIPSALENHVKNYLWIHNNYGRAIYLDKKYFLEEVKSVLNKKKSSEISKKINQLKNKEKSLNKKIKQVCKKYNISRETDLFFGIVRQFSFWQDKRKENIQKMVFCMDQVIRECSKRYNESYSNLKKYFEGEIIDLIDRGKKVSKKELDRRKKLVFLVTLEKGRIKKSYFYGRDAQEICDIATASKKDLVKDGTLKGFVASQGRGQAIIKGKVRIVFDPIKDKFEKGEILVAGMTRPEYVPLMKKAKAIITNEGGITTHAAIVSRELKVPCIIGTKIATKVLKDGDKVEIDTEKGIVRKIGLDLSKTKKNAIPVAAKKQVWFKLSDIPHANYVSLFAYNLINPIIDYPKIGIDNHIKEGFVEWNNGVASYHLKTDQFNDCADVLASNIIKMTKRNKNIVKKYYLLAKELMNKSKRFRQLKFSDMSDKRLIVEFKKIAELHRQNHLYGGILTFLPDEEQQRVSNAVLNKITELIKKSKLKLDMIECWNILTTPIKQSFREKEEIDLLILSIKVLQDKDLCKSIRKKGGSPDLLRKNKKIYKLFVDHYNKYCWIPYMYTGPAYDMDHYYLKIKENINQGLTSVKINFENLKAKHRGIRKKQKNILAKFRPNLKERELLEFASEIVFIKSYRKDTFYHLFYCYEPFFKEVAKRIDVNSKYIGFLFPWEFENAIINKTFSEQDLKQRKVHSLYYIDKNQVQFYFGRNVDKFKRSINIEKTDNSKGGIKGMIAYPGFVKGVVRIVQEPKDMVKMNQNDILISQMTNPDIVPAMKKASAIVTNTGGLTCHASILSRELKIPCIVGTKIATKVLKDGDYVEVDANKGIVRKIK